MRCDGEAFVKEFMAVWNAHDVDGIMALMDSGDLPNLVANAGVGLLHATTTRVTLSPGPLSLFDASGSAIIVHVNEDTYCPDGPDAGCAGGGRAACGIIEPAD
jgi:Cu-Zn family superoxide dismutase